MKFAVAEGGPQLASLRRHGKCLHFGDTRFPFPPGDAVGNASAGLMFARLETESMRDFRDAKAMAKALKLALETDGVTMAHTRALEIVARQFDFPNWNVLSAKIEADEQPDAIAFQQAVPIVRIFDLAKVQEFYFGFLGFTLDWEHRYGENFPVYMQVSRAGLRLHLSEHAGDATPGGNMCVYMKGIRAFHAELIGKNYRFMKPGLEKSGDRLEVTVTDPFNNHIRFMEVMG